MIRNIVYNGIFIILTFVLIVACAPRYVWYHPTNDKYAYDRDASQCDISAQEEKYRAMQAFGGSQFAGLGMVAAYDRAFENCMLSRGWRKVLNDSQTASSLQESEGQKEVQKQETDRPEKSKVTTTEEWGQKPQDAEIIHSLLLQDKKVALAIIVEDVNHAGVSSDPELDSLREAVKDKLLAELEYIHLYAFGKAKNFSLIDRAHLKALLNEQAFGQTGAVSDETSAKIGKLVGATHILLVKKTFLAEGETSSLEYRRLMEVESGKVLAVAVRTEKRNNK